MNVEQCIEILFITCISGGYSTYCILLKICCFFLKKNLFKSKNKKRILIFNAS